jgi:hypothetical protein
MPTEEDLQGGLEVLCRRIPGTVNYVEPGEDPLAAALVATFLVGKHYGKSVGHREVQAKKPATVPRSTLVTLEAQTPTSRQPSFGRPLEEKSAIPDELTLSPTRVPVPGDCYR